MKNKFLLYTTGLLGLASLFMAGCGSTDDFVAAPPNQTLREFIVIPNFSGNTVAVRAIDIGTGNTAHVSLQNTGNAPTMVKTHPGRNIFYVSNSGSNNVSGFSIDANGNTAPLAGSPYAGPVGSRNVHIHPSGRFVYVAGTTTLQSYSINQDGSLNPIGTAPMASTPRNDGGFTANGGLFYLPVSNGLLTFNIDANGVAQALSNTVVAGISTTNDFSIHPNGSVGLLTCQVAGATNDRIEAFTFGANGQVTAQSTLAQTFDIGLGQIARNGVYYVGDLNNPQVRAFTVGAGGTLTPLAGSPFSTPGGGSQTGLDPTESLVYSAPNVTSTLAGSRRLADNSLQAAANSPFNDNLNNLFVFDFFQFIITQ